MDADEVVIEIEEVQRYRVRVVFQFLAESVRQPRHAPSMHADVEVVPFRVGRADVRHVRISADNALDSSRAFGRAIAARSFD